MTDKEVGQEFLGLLLIPLIIILILGLPGIIFSIL